MIKYLISLLILISILLSACDMRNPVNISHQGAFEYFYAIPDTMIIDSTGVTQSNSTIYCQIVNTDNEPLEDIWIKFVKLSASSDSIGSVTNWDADQWTNYNGQISAENCILPGQGTGFFWIKAEAYYDDNWYDAKPEQLIASSDSIKITVIQE